MKSSELDDTMQCAQTDAGSNLFSRGRRCGMFAKLPQSFVVVDGRVKRAHSSSYPTYNAVWFSADFHSNGCWKNRIDSHSNSRLLAELGDKTRATRH
jgi:hypothetical protein